jgi:uncharacterized protein involved in exopolysaccharide biosynthesis
MEDFSAHRRESPITIRVPYREVTDDSPEPCLHGNHAARGGAPTKYSQIVFRRRGLIIVIAFLGGIAGLLITLPQTPVYQAKAVLELLTVNNDSRDAKQVGEKPPSPDTPADVPSQLEIIRSDGIKEGAIARLKLSSVEDLKQQRSRPSAWRRALNLPEAKSDDHEALIRAMANSVKARAIGESRIIEVLAESVDRTLAADFANAIVNEYIDQNTESRFRMSQRSAEWLDRQLDDLRIKLERSEEALQAYAREAGLTFAGDDDKDSHTSAAEEKLGLIQQSLAKATTDRIAKQSRYETASTSQQASLTEDMNDQARENQKSLAEFRRQLADLSPVYTAEHPKVKKLRAQIENLENALSRDGAAVIARLKTEYDESVQREKLLTVEYNDHVHAVTQVGDRSIQYSMRKRELDTQRQVYLAMLKRLNESTMSSTLVASNIRIVTKATPPEKAHKPSALLNSAIGLLTGLFLAIAFIMLRHRAARTSQSVPEVQHWTHLPELEDAQSISAFHRNTRQ